MRRSVTITVPGDVPNELTPNASRHLHWGTKTKIKDQIQNDTVRCAQEVIGTGHDSPYFAGKVRCYVTVGRGKRRQMLDPDNLTASLKFYIDALKIAKVITDDKAAYFDMDKPVQERDPDGVGFVRFRITEAA